MANVTNRNPIVIDVAGTAVNLPDVRRITAIYWRTTEADALAANDDLVIRHAVHDENATGDIIFESRVVASTDSLYGDSLVFGDSEPYMAPNGINVLIDGGAVYIYS